MEASLRHSRVVGGQKDFPLSSVICAPVVYSICILEVFRARQHLRSLAPVMNDE